MTSAKDSFDVFLAHNSQDKTQIAAIGAELKRRGLKPWIDKEQIAPGRWFQDVIQGAISKVRSAAIFIGPKGLGRWQVLELRAFISQCVKKEIPVIPVLLPGVDCVPDELIFLQELNWVHFLASVDEKDALDSLEWGIRGYPPMRKGATTPIPAPKKTKKKPTERKPRNKPKQVISSSGEWMLLSGGFYQTESVTRGADGVVTVQVAPRSVEEEATLYALQRGGSQSDQRFGFAHGNDGFLFGVKKMQSERKQGKSLWRIILDPDESNYRNEPTYQMPHGDLKPEDVAELRAKWILLDQPPKGSGKRAIFSTEEIVRGNGLSIPIRGCVLKPLFGALKRTPRRFLEQARLAAILAIRGGDVVERVMELSLGPIHTGKVHVRFWGFRRERYSGQTPSVIQVEGDCSLQ